MCHSRWPLTPVAGVLLTLVLIGFVHEAWAGGVQAAPPGPTATSPQAAPETPGQPAGEAQRPPRDRDARPETDTTYSMRAVWLAVAIAALMGLLFWLLFTWSSKIERAGYFATLYTDAVENIEYSRLSSPHIDQWERGDYHREVLDAASDRARSWITETREHQRPVPDPELVGLAQQLGRQYEIDDERWRVRFVSMLRRDDPWGGQSGTGGLGGSRRPGTRLPGLEDTPQAPEGEADARFRDLLNAHNAKRDAWIERARGQVTRWYQADLAEARTRAKAQATKALDVDFSALRGRGPEFVLEFTTVVVIIFAAVILGILKVLDPQQIGTLLAAIAGYVLGRATTRTRPGEGAPAAPAAPAPPAAPTAPAAPRNE